MKLFFFLSLVFTLALYSCEDKKKPSEVKEETIKESVNSVKVSEENTTKEETAPQYPLITKDNVITFLTQYGKDNLETQVRITTNHGIIDIELYKDTPLHRANFIYLVKQKYFDETFFHRVVPNFIIQGGNSDERKTPNKRKKLGKKYLLPAELKNGRKHIYGSISGAKEYRENPDKQTAPFEFFIFLGPLQSTGHLNGNYTIFGRVTEGMDVVETIANQPKSDDDWPLLNVIIESVVIR